MMSKSVIDLYVQSENALYNETPSRGNQAKYKITADNGDILWVKQDYLGYEGLSEVAASRAAQKTNITSEFSVVEYFPCYIIKDGDIQHKKTGCYSKDFHINGCSELSLDKLCAVRCDDTFDNLLKRGRGDIKKFYSELIEKLDIPFMFDYLSLLFDFDRMICNEDRHQKNILVMKKDDIIIPAPIFDNGAGFFSDTTYDYYKDMSYSECLKKVKAKPFISSFDKQVRLANSFSEKRLIINDNHILISDLNEIYEEYAVNRVAAVLRSNGFIVE